MKPTAFIDVDRVEVLSGSDVAVYKHMSFPRRTRVRRVPSPVADRPGASMLIDELTIQEVEEATPHDWVALPYFRGSADLRRALQKRGTRVALYGFALDFDDTTQDVGSLIRDSDTADAVIVTLLSS